MELAYKVEGQAMVYTMPKEVDHHVAKRLCRDLDLLIDSYHVKELILDFNETEFMDSSGIGVIIGRCKTMQFYGGGVEVTNMGSRVHTMFYAAGLYKIVKVKETEGKR